jgi:hypothetical protein
MHMPASVSCLHASCLRSAWHSRTRGACACTNTAAPVPTSLSACICLGAACHELGRQRDSRAQTRPGRRAGAWTDS